MSAEITEIAIIVPTLGRPHLLEPLLENIAAVTPPVYRVVFVVDPEDDPSWEVMGRVFRDHPEAMAIEHAGTYPVKTNRGVAMSDSEFVALVNDDVVFHEGWWELARSALRRGVDVIGPSDTTPATEGGQAVTMPIVRRSYIQSPGGAWGERGKALHEGYHHNFSETELWELARFREVARYISRCVIEHRHPDWGTAGIDETYRKGAHTGWAEDEALFNQRREEWLAALSPT